MVLPLWDAYFLADDPFFVFFLALVMLINGKEYVFELAKSPDTLVQELASMPSGLSADDVGDMCDLARHFSTVTPTSFRADFNSRLFNSGGRRPAARSADASAAVQAALYEKLCLCVSVDTVLRHTEGAIKFFVIDIRPIAQYDAGHLPYAWHLDATLMLDNPEIFSDEVVQLEDALQASLQHPTFLGSGRSEEDNSLSMVVSHFLQRKHQYVSIVKGGFKVLHAKLEFEGRTASALTGNSPSRLLAAIDPNAPPPPTETSSEKKKFSLGWGKKSSDNSKEKKEKKEKKKEPIGRSALSSMSSMWSKAKGSATDSKKGKATDGAAGADADADAGNDGDDAGAGADAEQKGNSKDGWGAKMKGWGTAFKESLKEAAIATGNAADELAEASAVSMKKLQERTKEGIEQVKQEAKEAMEKRKAQKGEGMYRGNERPMFSIDDDDEEDQDHHRGGQGGGADLDLAGAVLRRSAAGELFVSVSKAKKQPVIVHYFQCSEVGAEGYLFPSHLLLTQTHLIKLRDRSGKRGEAIVLSRRELSRIQRITAKKRHPNILTFVFDAEQHPSSDDPDPQNAAGEQEQTQDQEQEQEQEQAAADTAGEGSTGMLKEDVLNSSVMHVDIGGREDEGPDSVSTPLRPGENGQTVTETAAGAGNGGDNPEAAADPTPLASFAPALDDGEDDEASGSTDAPAGPDAEEATPAETGAGAGTEEGGAALAAEDGNPATGDATADVAKKKEEEAAPAPAAAETARKSAPRVTQIVERFMIPEAATAKEAFRTLIVAGRGAPE